ncbi:hypothetical protein [Treponema sp. JC4]|uniref:hypothetical protein n=1 Tax=Treponema sp. JC4 TaxID=1124982 RepID=UPI00178C493B|nr:hypothetical protein [Treponema sp. JC4]
MQFFIPITDIESRRIIFIDAINLYFFSKIRIRTSAEHNSTNAFIKIFLMEGVNTCGCIKINSGYIGPYEPPKTNVLRIAPKFKN